MLKKIIEKIEDAPEAVRSFYKESGGKFILQVEDDDGGELRRAKEHEKNLRVAAEAKVTELEGKLAAADAKVTTVTAERDAAVAAKGQDVQALEASWQNKVTAAEAERDAVRSELTSEVSRLLVTTTAERLATEISTVPEMFAESVIAKRLVAEKGADGQYFTRVLDADGKPSASTVDDLKKELLANKKYAGIIIAGKGSGGGAKETPSGGGAPDKKYLDYSDQELSELRRTDKAQYDRLLEAHRKGEEPQT